MRPVNKGKREQEYKPYQTAKRELFEAIGPYCSYCERIIELGGAIEHIQPKSKVKENIRPDHPYAVTCRTFD